MSDYWDQFLTTDDDPVDNNTDNEKDITKNIGEETIPAMDVQSSTASMESFDAGAMIHPASNAIHSIPFFGTLGNPRPAPAAQNNKILVRTTDGKNFRIYFKENLLYFYDFTSRIAHFLDSRTSDQTVTFIFGTNNTNIQITTLGSIISAIKSCKAETFGVCAGYCSICETAMWCDCDHQIMYRYGALTFGITEIIQILPVYSNYFDLFFAKGMELGIITKEEVNEMKSTGKELMLLYSDYAKRMEHNKFQKEYQSNNQ